MEREKDISAVPTCKRILIVDAFPVVRAGVKAAFANHPSWEVCGETATHPEALIQIRNGNPHVVILGLNTDKYHWLDLLKDICLEFPELAVLVVSNQVESIYARRAINAGARGYVTLVEPLAEFSKAVESLIAGETYISRQVMTQIASQIVGRKQDGHVPPSKDLTGRELEIFELTGIGLSVRQIADRLNLGKSTVETHRSHIKKKFHLLDNSEFFRSAVRWKGGSRSPEFPSKNHSYHAA